LSPPQTAQKFGPRSGRVNENLRRSRTANLITGIYKGRPGVVEGYGRVCARRKLIVELTDAVRKLCRCAIVRTKAVLIPK